MRPFGRLGFGVALVLALAFALGERAPTAAGVPSRSQFDGVQLISPASGTRFTIGTNGTIVFQWSTHWFWTGGVSKLHFFIGRSPGADEVVHEHYDCPASTAPSCPTSRSVYNFDPGTYYWGVAHTFPDGVSGGSDSSIWSFTVVAPSVPPPPQPTPAPQPQPTPAPQPQPTPAPQPQPTPAPQPQPTPAPQPQPTPAPQPQPTPTDRDKDGIADPSDACLDQPAGAYDTNKNGCPGPYARIKPRLAYGRILTSRGYTNIEWISISRLGLPEGARVTLKAGRLLNVQLTAGKAGAVRTARIGRVDFRGGATFSLKVARPGSVGYYADIRVPTTRKPYPIREQCIAPFGPERPVRCATVDRGR